MNIILSMMISGNCLFVLYWMVKTVFKNFFSFRAEDILLKKGYRNPTGLDGGLR